MSQSSGAPTEWTYEEYARLPDDGNRYEVIDGEVCVTPAPGLAHQQIAANIFFLLRSYVERYQIGKLFWDVDLLFVSGQFLRPDMVFVPAARLAELRDRGVEVVPGLVVEVLSPHSRRIDRELKPPRYRDFGVPEYWVVDPKARAIEVYRLVGQGTAPEVCAEVVTWRPEASVPGLELPVAEVFAGI